MQFGRSLPRFSSYDPTLVGVGFSRANPIYSITLAAALSFVLASSATTNLVQWSQDFANAYWTVNNVTVSADVVAAPDGTLTADKLTETASTGGHFLSRAAVFTAGTVYTKSVYMKAAERTWGFLSLGTIAAYFNLATGAVGVTIGTVVPQMTYVGNGWYRCSITFTADASNLAFRVFTASNNNVANYTGTAGSGIYIWGGQGEPTTSPSAYLATAGAIATRRGAINNAYATQQDWS